MVVIEEQSPLLGRREEKSVEISSSLRHEFSSQTFLNPQFQGTQKFSNSLALRLSLILSSCFIGSAEETPLFKFKDFLF